jgi:hypothetical protein
MRFVIAVGYIHNRCFGLMPISMDAHCFDNFTSICWVLILLWRAVCERCDENPNLRNSGESYAFREYSEYVEHLQEYHYVRRENIRGGNMSAAVSIHVKGSISSSGRCAFVDLDMGTASPFVRDASSSNRSVGESRRAVAGVPSSSSSNSGGNRSRNQEQYRAASASAAAAANITAGDSIAAIPPHMRIAG